MLRLKTVASHRLSALKVKNSAPNALSVCNAANSNRSSLKLLRLKTVAAHKLSALKADSNSASLSVNSHRTDASFAHVVSVKSRRMDSA